MMFEASRRWKRVLIQVVVTDGLAVPVPPRRHVQGSLAGQGFEN